MHFLTTKYFLKGLFFSKIERFLPELPRIKITYPGYTLQQVLRKQTASDIAAVGQYTDQKSQRVIIKSFRYKTKNLSYEQLINEGNMYNLLSRLSQQIPGSIIRFPKVIKTIDAPHTISLISEYITGQDLRNEPTSKKLSVITQCIQQFAAMSRIIDVNVLTLLPKRSRLQTFLSFPVYFSLSFMKEKKSRKQLLSYAKIFLSAYLPLLLKKTSFVIAHKDLHSQNIKIVGKYIYILDTEVSVIAEEQTDLSLIARYFAHELKNELPVYLQSVLISETDKKRFLALTIFYTMQILAIRDKQDPDYPEAKRYINTYLPKIITTLQEKEPKKSWVEKAIHTSLSIISIVQKIMPTTISNNLVLCYHSINNDDWRFSTKIKDFENQMEYLAKHANLVSLKKLLSSKKSFSKKPQVSITFDDGYTDFMEHALPILKKYHIPATVFVLGDPTKADRKELDNQKSIISSDSLKKLTKSAVTIGYHTKTHTDLRQLNDATLTEEIITSKERLEKLLGLPITYFAYPRGLYSPRIIAAVNKAGYTAAFTVDGGTITKSSHPLLLNRISIDGDLSYEQFSAMISPLGTIFMQLVMKILTVKEELSFKIRHQQQHAAN